MTAYNRMMQRSGRFIPQGVLIAAVSLTLLLPACRPKGQAKSSAPSLPNILLISLDACRADHLSCYGYARKTSPFLDALAAQGTRFARAFCNTHGTGPSHATLLMSLYQETHRMEYTSHPGSLPGDPVPPDAMMIQEFLHARGYTTLGITDGGQLASGYGFHRGFDVYDDDGGGIVRGCRKLTDLVRAHIGGGRPLFIFYHTYEVHSPYLPPEHLRNVFGTYAHTIAPVNEVLGKYAATAWRDLTQGDLEFLKSQYDAEILGADAVLRSAFARLRDLGFFSDAVAVVTGDHGEEFGEHGGLLHRDTLYEEILHVPLIFYGSRVPRGRVDERMVSLVDVAPTLVELAGFMDHPRMMGRSMTDFSAPWEKVFSQYGGRRFSVRTARWKYIRTVAPANEELYDLRLDPHEKTNAAAQQEALVRRFRSDLARWMKRQPALAAARGAKVKLGEEQVRQLKSLGYVEGAP